VIEDLYAAFTWEDFGQSRRGSSTCETGGSSIDTEYCTFASCHTSLFHFQFHFQFHFSLFPSLCAVNVLNT
jgi:hypothetical protein